MLAGHDEGEGQLIEEHHLTQQLDQATQQPIIETKRFVQFYGMSSDTAMKSITEAWLSIGAVRAKP